LTIIVRFSFFAVRWQEPTLISDQQQKRQREENMNDLYVRLAAHLDKLPIPFPSTENGIELKILRNWFAPQQAQIALKMNGFPEPAATIAKRLNMSSEDLEPVLAEMSRKGLIFRTTQHSSKGSQDPVLLYSLVSLAEGLWEFRIHSVTREEVEDEIEMVDEYLEFFMDKGWFKTKTTQHRVIPISKSVSAEMEIMQYDQAEIIIKSQTKIAVMPCVCRKYAKMLGKGCNHPSEVCLAFGTGAYYFLENGWGHEISQDEALAILKVGMEAGLVIQPGNGQKTWSLCMCCSCACQLLKSLNRMEKPAQAVHTNYYAQCNTENCTACGNCVERCPMEAIELKDTAVVNKDRCIGCGVCVAACDFDAMALHQKKVENRYLPPRDIIEMQRKIAKERGLID
jgi:ferredoxin